MSKQTILATSLNIFAHFGIKSVSMSQIAGSIRISKRTLYTYFGSKEELLCGCMEHERENISAMLEDIEKQTRNPVEKVVQSAIKIVRYRSSFCPLFYKDMIHFCDANVKLEAISESIRKRFVTYFKEGAKEGFFRSECNYDVITHALMEQVVLQSRIGLSHRNSVFYTFLRGLCTNKGITVLEKLMPAEEDVYDYEYDFR